MNKAAVKRADNLREAEDEANADANRDPITGAPGAHPVGTGVGATSVGLAGAAIGVAVGGPIGGAVGLVAGAVAGGLAGKGVAEKMDPTVEDLYWKENYLSRSYVDRNAPFSTYQQAYRTGYEGRGRYPGKRFEDAETELQRDYETARRADSLAWDKARYATRDAWDRGELSEVGDAPISSNR